LTTDIEISQEQPLKSASLDGEGIMNAEPNQPPKPEDGSTLKPVRFIRLGLPGDPVPVYDLDGKHFYVGHFPSEEDQAAIKARLAKYMQVVRVEKLATAHLKDTAAP
jgi:hypothetical protein